MTLRRYVLGDLDGPARERVEESLVMDSGALEPLGVVEDGLIEEYLDGVLPPGQGLLFERTFLSSSQGRSRLRLAKSLRDRAKARSPSTGPKVRSAAWVGLAAALVLSLVGNVWQATRLPGLNPSGVSLPGGLTPGASPPTFTLTGGLLRAGGSLQRLVIPANSALVRLRLELADTDHPLYRIVLMDDEGDEVLAASKLEAEEANGQTAIVIPVPSTILPGGDYQAKLSGEGPDAQLEGVASYSFRVTRE